MKKLLLTLTLLLTLGLTAKAEDLKFSFSSSETWTNLSSTEVSQETVISNSSYDFKINHAYRISSNALFLRKSTGYIILPTFDQPVEKIQITGYSGCAKAATVTVSGEDLTSITTAKIKETTVTVPVNSEKAGVEYKIEANSSANAQISTIIVTLSGAPTECPVPEFSVADGADVYAGQTISVDGKGATSVKLSVDGKDVAGTEYIIPDDAVVGSTITLTAKSTLDVEGGEPLTANASITVNVIEKPVYTMFNYDVFSTAFKLGDSNHIITDEESVTVDDVTLTVTGRHTTIETDKGLHLYKPLTSAEAGTITLSVPAGFYITAVSISGENLTHLDKEAEFTNSDVSVNTFTTSATSSGSANIKEIKVNYAAMPAEIVDITYEVLKGKTVNVLNYIMHVNYLKADDTYEVTLTVKDQSGATVATVSSTPELMEQTTEAPARTLDPNAVPSTHKLKGSIQVKDLTGETAYTAELAANLNGEETPSKTVPNIDFQTGTTGIEDVTIDGNEAAVYYNLQGVRVAEPQAGQIYIVRRGAKATKELMK